MQFNIPTPEPEARQPRIKGQERTNNIWPLLVKPKAFCGKSKA